MIVWLFRFVFEDVLDDEDHVLDKHRVELGHNCLKSPENSEKKIMKITVKI